VKVEPLIVGAVAVETNRHMRTTVRQRLIAPIHS